MNKIKLVNKSNVAFLVVKNQKGQQLNMREVEAISKREIDGLLFLDVKQSKKAFELLYNVSGFISFANYLKTPITKTLFASLLNNIYCILQSMQNSYFNNKGILLDFNYIMINPATKRLSFVYVPIQYFDNEINLKDFLLKIAHNGIFDSSEDISYVKEYISILNNGINFSLFDLEQFINKISGKIAVNNATKKCKKCGKEISDDIKFCPACGNNIKGIDNKDKSYNPLDRTVQNEQPKEDEIVREEPKRANTQNFSETTVLGAEEIEDEGTTVLENNDQPSSPYLIREKNEEKIEVNKPSFRIGKEKRYCDYFVSDNNAVSRSHADIITKNGRYFIVDNNSTNKTYVDDRTIQINTEVEIFSNTRIRLANEDFIFYIV